ncbi:hypothetical protein L6452_00447 [Arctium lappa]|uniref:Uncharacterized protein n=1 Tax=Arctium lappa TaxID=4217 RepID=A0ACB9FF75_ARCLA|nr:hypothetical protein L6452_00447 [Arctium lappa]
MTTGEENGQKLLRLLCLVGAGKLCLRLIGKLIVISPLYGRDQQVERYKEIYVATSTAPAIVGGAIESR